MRDQKTIEKSDKLFDFIFDFIFELIFVIAPIYLLKHYSSFEDAVLFGVVLIAIRINRNRNSDK